MRVVDDGVLPLFYERGGLMRGMQATGPFQPNAGYASKQRTARAHMHAGCMGV